MFERQHQLKLDVYRPTNAHAAPVIVFFWGGRWEDGDKSMYRFVGAELASKGFVVVIPNYRLYPDVTFPAFVNDSAKAVAWTHEHISQYGGNANEIVLMGHSAGAYNAAMLALNPAYLHAVGGSRQWIRGMIGLGGPYDFLPLVEPDLKAIFGPPSQYPITQPIHWADGTNPPMLLIESRADTIVYPKNTRNLYAKIKKNGGPVEKFMVDDLSHPMLIGVVSNLLSSQSPILEKIVSFADRLTSEKQVRQDNGSSDPLAVTAHP
jgi:acetyl esterase/lipase